MTRHDDTAKDAAAITWRDILIGAADIIERNGLEKGAYRNPGTGACCTVGAMRMTAFGDITPRTNSGFDFSGHENYPAYQTALDAMQAKVNKDTDWWGYDITDWNDNENRDALEIITTIREVAAS